MIASAVKMGEVGAARDAVVGQVSHCRRLDRRSGVSMEDLAEAESSLRGATAAAVDATICFLGVVFQRLPERARDHHLKVLVDALVEECGVER